MVTQFRNGRTTAQICDIIKADPHAVGAILAARAGCSKSTIDRLRGEMREDCLIPPKPARETMPTQRIARMTPETMEQAQAMRRRGVKYSDIGAALGFGATTIQNHLNGRRMPERKPQPFSLDDLALAVGLREQGKTNAQIGATLGFHEVTIQGHLGTTPRMPSLVGEAGRAEPLCRMAESMMAKGLSERAARYQAGRERERRAQARVLRA